MQIERLGLDRAGRGPVCGVTLQLRPGERVGLVGPSGAGKSTIGRLLAGWVRPEGGTLVVNGAPVHRWPRPRWFHRQVQVLNQAPGASLDPLRTLGQHLREARRVAGRDDDGTAYWVAQGLSPTWLERVPGSLSGGQRHRAALARVLAVEPRFLVLDEPTQGLDPPRALELQAALDGLSGVGVLWISHRLAEVEGRTERLGVVDRGRLVELGPTGQVLTAPSHPASRAWVEAARRWASGPEAEP